LRTWLFLGLFSFLVYYSGITKYINYCFSFALFVVAVASLYALCVYAIAMNDDERKSAVTCIRRCVSPLTYRHCVGRKRKFRRLRSEIIGIWVFLDRRKRARGNFEALSETRI